MSIETLLKENTEALDRNTAALLKASGGAAAGSTGGAPATTTTKGKTGGKTKSGATMEEMQAALMKVKDDHGMEEAKPLIKKFGKVDKMADIKPADYQAVYDAAVKRHAELSEAGGEEGDGEDDGI